MNPPSEVANPPISAAIGPSNVFTVSATGTRRLISAGAIFAIVPVMISAIGPIASPIFPIAATNSGLARTLLICPNAPFTDSKRGFPKSRRIPLAVSFSVDNCPSNVCESAFIPPPNFCSAIFTAAAIASGNGLTKLPALSN